MITGNSSHLWDAALDNNNYTLTATLILPTRKKIELTADDFMVSGNSVTIGSSTSDTLVGQAITKTATLVLNNSTAKFSGISFVGGIIKLFVVYDLSTYGELNEVIPYGIYIIKSITNNIQTVTLNCSDFMCLADETFSTQIITNDGYSLTWDISSGHKSDEEKDYVYTRGINDLLVYIHLALGLNNARDLVSDYGLQQCVCIADTTNKYTNYADIIFFGCTVNKNTTISFPVAIDEDLEQYTYKEVLGYIAATVCANVYFDMTGNLVFKSLFNPSTFFANYTYGRLDSLYPRLLNLLDTTQTYNKFNHHTYPILFGGKLSDSQDVTEEYNNLILGSSQSKSVDLLTMTPEVDEEIQDETLNGSTTSTSTSDKSYISPTISYDLISILNFSNTTITLSFDWSCSSTKTLTKELFNSARLTVCTQTKSYFDGNIWHYPKDIEYTIGMLFDWAEDNKCGNHICTTLNIDDASDILMTDKITFKIYSSGPITSDGTITFTISNVMLNYGDTEKPYSLSLNEAKIYNSSDNLFGGYLNTSKNIPVEDNVDNIIYPDNFDTLDNNKRYNLNAWNSLTVSYDKNFITQVSSTLDTNSVSDSNYELIVSKDSTLGLYRGNLYDLSDNPLFSKYPISQFYIKDDVEYRDAAQLYYEPFRYAQILELLIGNHQSTFSGSLIANPLIEFMDNIYIDNSIQKADMSFISTMTVNFHGYTELSNNISLFTDTDDMTYTEFVEYVKLTNDVNSNYSPKNLLNLL